MRPGPNSIGAVAALSSGPPNLVAESPAARHHAGVANPALANPVDRDSLMVRVSPTFRAPAAATPATTVDVEKSPDGSSAKLAVEVARRRASAFWRVVSLNRDRTRWDGGRGLGTRGNHTPVGIDDGGFDNRPL